MGEPENAPGIREFAPVIRVMKLLLILRRRIQLPPHPGLKRDDLQARDHLEVTQVSGGDGASSLAAFRRKNAVRRRSKHSLTVVALMASLTL
jgi:hypothetical protein